jgi:uncharacterized protein YegP (UPF0339 family)
VSTPATHAELYRDSRGEWRWRLLAKNGRVIADSGEGYVDKADARRGLRLATAAPPTRVDEVVELP